MALLFADSFDHYPIGRITEKWTNITQAAVWDIRPEYARPPGGMGLRCASNTTAVLQKTLAASKTKLIVGFAFYVETLAASTICRLDDTGAEQCSLRLDASGHFVISRAGTALATSTNAISISTWYYVEFAVTIHNTTGQYEVRVNGSSTGWIPQSAANQNTRAGTPNSANGITLCVISGTAIVRWDDLYVCDSNSPNGDFLGPLSVLARYPAAAGTHTEWTGNYADNFANVNEPTADGDGTFNQSGSANQIDTFEMQDPPSGTILAIQHVIEARQDTGAQRTFCPIQRDGSNDREGTTFSLSSSHQMYCDPKDVDPATGAAYTAANLAAYQAGYKLKS